jgi:V/A-type H+-transporting ATPase subunit A
MRAEAMKVLQQEAELKEIARLVGVDALSNRDRLVLGTAKAIREDFLHQNAFDEVDTYTSFPKQYRMLRNIMAFNRIAGEAVEQGVQADELFGLDVLGEIARARYTPESDIAELDGIASRIESQVRALVQKRGGAEETAS